MFDANDAKIRVVLFSGGRGSGAIAERIGTDARVELTVAINGYDDGASTGEVRRFFGDCLGPSDFRKNASRFARLRQTCAPELIDLLDRRLAVDAEADQIQALIEQVRADGSPAIGDRLNAFEELRRVSPRPLRLADASVGNLVFAGSFLTCKRHFNDAVDDYCGLHGLPMGLIENVTDGANAFLVALDNDGRLLGSEEEIVDAKLHNRVREIYLIEQALDTVAREALQANTVDQRRRFLEERSVHPTLNPRLARALQVAHLIIYAPGTQHSSLFPSYLTVGLGDAIAANLGAVKLLLTNIQEDAEITGSSAVDLIDRAVFYLRDKGRLTTPAPCLITHYLLNDPAKKGEEAGRYVPLGRLESLEDPRLVRVGNYEVGQTGRHDATRVLAPYIDGFIARARSVQSVAIVLNETRSPNKLAQTLLEMVRGGLSDLQIRVTVYHASERPMDPAFLERLPFPVVQLVVQDPIGQDQELRLALAAGEFEYVVIFDSSGMYHGEDITGLASHLAGGRLDAVWGSRRLSVRDIHESYRLRYQHKRLLGAISAVGSHALSLQYLALYGRYISDTLSGARVVRTTDALAISCRLSDSVANHHLLSTLLRRRAEIMEIPVHFFAISPDQVRRTSIADGIRSLSVAIRERLR